MLILYTNLQNEILTHQPKNPKDDGVYLRGYCEIAKGLRTWRKDRVIAEFPDQAALDTYLQANPLDVIATTAQEARRAKRQEGQVFEICFTGFSAKERAELEATATASGMRVKKEVTANLDLLCTGGNAGPVKMQKAEKQGTCLLTADEFRDLVTDGVMPEGCGK